MRLPLALLALLGAGCSTTESAPIPESAAYGEAPQAEPAEADGSVDREAVPPLPGPRQELAETPRPRAEPPTAPPPTGPVDELFRAPSDPGRPVAPSDPGAPPPVAGNPFPGSPPPTMPGPSTAKPLPPPPPPPHPPRPWGGNDPCPPCGMG